MVAVLLGYELTGPELRGPQVHASHSTFRPAIPADHLSTSSTLRLQPHDAAYLMMALLSSHFLMFTCLVRTCIGISVTPSMTTSNFAMGRQYICERTSTSYNAAFRCKRATASAQAPQLCSIRGMTNLQILLLCCSARQLLG